MNSFRRRVSSRPCDIEATRKPSRMHRTSHEPNGINRAASCQKVFTTLPPPPPPPHSLSPRVTWFRELKFFFSLQDSWKTNGGNNSDAKRDQTVNNNTRLFVELQPVPALDPPDEGRYLNQTYQKDISSSGPLQVSASSSFAWAKKPKEDRSYINSHSRFTSRSHTSHALDHSNILQSKIPSKPKGQANRDIGHAAQLNSNSNKQHEIAKHEMLTQRSQPEIPERYEIAKHVIMNQWSHPGKPGSFNSRDSYHSRDLLDALYKTDAKSTKHSILVLVQLIYLFFPPTTLSM